METAKLVSGVLTKSTSLGAESIEKVLSAAVNHMIHAPMETTPEQIASVVKSAAKEVDGDAVDSVRDHIIRAIDKNHGVIGSSLKKNAAKTSTVSNSCRAAK